jgi:hypothetical protein
MLHSVEGAKGEDGFLPDVSSCADLRRFALLFLDPYFLVLARGLLDLPKVWAPLVLLGRPCC